MKLEECLNFPPTSEEGTSKGNTAAVPSESEVEEEEAEEDEDYSDQQYPPADDKYKGWKTGWKLWNCREFPAWISKIWD